MRLRYTARAEIEDCFSLAEYDFPTVEINEPGVIGNYMSKHETINYVELAAKDLNAAKRFFSAVFGWRFTDYGTEYTALADAGLEGGFYLSDLSASTDNGSALVVIYSDEIEQTQQKIEAAGGLINKRMFSFPGGKRFHFIDPIGNEFAVWTHVDP